MSVPRRVALLLLVGAFGLRSLAACVGDSPQTGAMTPTDAGGVTTGDAASDASSVVDAASADSTDADASVDAAPTKDPSTLAGLVLWLRADKDVTVANGTNVTRWKDQSGKGHDALIASAPYATLKSNAFATTPALPAVEFAVDPDAGGVTALVQGASIVVGTNDYLVIGVARSRQATNQGGPLLNIGVGFWLARPNDGFSVRHDDVDMLESAAKVTGNEWHLVAVRRKAPGLELRLDGDVVATSTDASVSGSIANAGGYNYIGSTILPFVGDLAELVWVIGATSDADVAGVEAHLKARYALGP